MYLPYSSFDPACSRRLTRHIREAHGDVWSLGGPIVIPVTTYGSMSDDVAWEARRRYPAAADVYKSACRALRLQVGDVMAVEGSDRLLLFLPLKSSFGASVEAAHLREALWGLSAWLLEHPLSSLVMPPLRCSPCQLSWKEIRSLELQWARSFPHMRIIMLSP